METSMIVVVLVAGILLFAAVQAIEVSSISGAVSAIAKGTYQLSSDSTDMSSHHSGTSGSGMVGGC